MDTIKTTLRTFDFDLHKPDQAEAWQAFKAKMSADYPHPMESLVMRGDGYFLPDLDGATIELETKYLFDNQWNAAPIAGDRTDKGRRLFDWAIEVWPDNRRLKRGHYLEQTAEMRAIRDNTMVCGYCGRQEPAAKGYVFCPHCIGSEYLKSSELHLTRMLPVSENDIRRGRAPLTKAERDHLLPQYRDAQMHGKTERDKVRIAKARASVEAEFRKRTDNAKTERDGFIWLMDHGVRTDNAIFYNHTGRFHFGWRQPVDAEVLSELLDVISEFRFPYDITTADGRTLSGEG